MYVFMRLVSLILVVIALMLLGADAVTTLEHNGHITVRTLGDLWDLFQHGGWEAAKAWNAAHLPSFVAWTITAILNCWGWAIFGALGVILAFVFGRSHHEEA